MAMGAAGLVGGALGGLAGGGGAQGLAIPYLISRVLAGSHGGTRAGPGGIGPGVGAGGNPFMALWDKLQEPGAQAGYARPAAQDWLRNALGIPAQNPASQPGATLPVPLGDGQFGAPASTLPPWMLNLAGTQMPGYSPYPLAPGDAPWLGEAKRYAPPGPDPSGPTWLTRVGGGVAGNGGGGLGLPLRPGAVIFRRA